LNKSIALAPNVMTNYLWLGEYYMIFDAQQAIPVFQRAEGKRQEAERILDELRKQSEQSYVSPMIFATVYVGLGDRDKAFSWLDKAYDDRSEALGFIRSDFRVDPIP
jgi:tetratricopeptide (TPR) repeat protein